MAQLLVRNSDGPVRKAGTVICAFNDLRIRKVHAQHICHRRNYGFNIDGLRPASLFQAHEERVSQYRFERVSKTEILRIGDNVELFGPRHIAVQEYIDRRIRHPLHRIFGREGREYWFGGRTEVSHSAYDHVWDRIHSDTNYREEFHKSWVLGRMEVQTYSLVDVDDFDNPDVWLGENIFEELWQQSLRA